VVREPLREHRQQVDWKTGEWMTDRSAQILLVAVEEKQLVRIREKAREENVEILSAETVGEAFLCFKDCADRVGVMVLDSTRLKDSAVELHDLVEHEKPEIEVIYLCTPSEAGSLRADGYTALEHPVKPTALLSAVKTALES
jgi:DNA-binding NtrC family response regulator